MTNLRHIPSKTGKVTGPPRKLLLAGLLPPGFFLHIVVNDLRESDRAGRLEHCKHLPSRRPFVVALAEWRWRALCHACAAEANARGDNRKEPAECDQCTDAVSPLRSFTAQFGPMMVTYRLCPDCCHSEAEGFGLW